MAMPANETERVRALMISVPRQLRLHAADNARILYYVQATKLPDKWDCTAVKVGIGSIWQTTRVGPPTQIRSPRMTEGVKQSCS